MKISGTATMVASPEQVWQAVHDPEALARSIPGCESLRELSPGRYAMTVMAGVAAIKGSYEGEVAVSDVSEPDRFTMKADGAGAPGTISTTVDVALAAAEGGGTTITYEADALVGGPIGGVGQRMLAGVARKMAGQMFTALDDDIAGVRREKKKPKGGVLVDEVPSGPRPINPVGTSVASLGSPGFVPGALFGAGVALAGVVVGWLIGRR
ncbi:carbon monoxide dehydrogenase subunit G [Knoellia sp. S7-12]|uniref:SRPBCC family protein n=1 Tax=Knoellia sp. S7-12 TaxID=3126698 RepID=UPI0033693A24